MRRFALVLLLATLGLAGFRDRRPPGPRLASRAITAGFAFLISALLEVSFLGFYPILEAKTLEAEEPPAAGAAGPGPFPWRPTIQVRSLVENMN